MASAEFKSYLAERKRNFGAERADFYKKHEDRGLIESVQSAIGQRQAAPIPELKRYFAAGNQRTAGMIAAFEGNFWKLRDTNGSGYDIAVKECVDARPAEFTVLDYMRRKIIHGRTAGSIVRNGSVFLALGEMGIGFEIVHSDCGAEGVAHKYHTGQFKGTPDADLTLIAESIPYPVAVESDSAKRTRLNGKHQANMAEIILERNDRGNPVFPIMQTWENWETKGVDLVWLSRTKREHDVIDSMRENAKMLWEIAHSLCRSPERQFAHTIFVYDPKRLGRFNDPRVIFDLLPNEAFCVPFDFSVLTNGNGGSLVSSGVGSVKYAGFHDGGHVQGVGGRDGNRHVMVIDPDPKVAAMAEQALLAHEVIEEFTANGETIIRAKYDLETRLVTFID